MHWGTGWIALGIGSALTWWSGGTVFGGSSFSSSFPLVSFFNVTYRMGDCILMSA